MYEKNYQLIIPNHEVHNLPLNIDYLKFFLKNRNNILMSDELKKIIEEKNINTTTNSNNLDLKTLLLIKRNR
jgi:outer membrane lipopolysaccharide assembly protein LptE/RlpB